MRKALGGFLVLLAVYQAAWVLLWFVMHVRLRSGLIFANVVGEGIAAVCCGIVGWHLLRYPSRTPPAVPAESGRSVTAQT